MPDPSPLPGRRVDDHRMQGLETKVDAVAKEIREVHDWLIGEPESSALGRQLLARSKDNSAKIVFHEQRIDALETWRSEWSGTWRFITSAGTILAIIGTVFGLLAYFGH